MHKTIIVSGLVAVLLAGWYISQSEMPDVFTDGDYTWKFTELGRDPEIIGMPRTKLELAYGGKAYPLGEYGGTCFVMEGSGWTLEENEVSGVICWWAGGGKEIGIFKEGGSLVVKEGEVDEGSAEVPGFRGNWKTLITLDTTQAQ